MAMMKKILLILLFVFSSTQCFAERNITLPESEDFSGTYTDIIRESGGCVHTTESGGGWDGNDAARFTPPTSGDSYCGLGIFNFSGTGQINVRVLYYASADFVETETRNNKLISVNPAENNRPMMYMTENGSGWNTITPGWNAALYPNFSDPNIFKLGDGNYEDQWVCIELEAVVATSEINIYITTQDGTYTGLYDQHIRETPFTNLIYIDFIGGYFNAGSFSASESTYFKLSHLEIDDSYIGPPTGFVTGLVNGVCGSNDGATLSSLTSGDPDNCSVGSVSSFSGTGPWTWDCLGAGGGSNDNCSASLQSVSSLQFNQSGSVNFNQAGTINFNQ